MMVSKRYRIPDGESLRVMNGGDSSVESGTGKICEYLSCDYRHEKDLKSRLN
jgi:hypothetical protein